MQSLNRVNLFRTNKKRANFHLSLQFNGQWQFKVARTII